MRKVLRRPDFRLLFSGLVASMVGESILLLALAIWVKDLTGSSGAAGMTIFAIVAPVVFAPLVGWIVDRFRRRPFLIVANLATAVALAPLLLVRDRGDVWLIYLVGVLYGFSYIAINAALNGLIKEVLPEDLLAEANGALQTVKQGLRLVGPILGATLYTAFGGWTLAAVGAVGFVLAAAAIAAMRVRDERTPQPPEMRWLAEVGAGVRHVAGEPSLRRTTIGVALAVFLLGFTETLVFAYVDDGLHRGPAFVGILVTVQGIGGLLGGLAAAGVVRRLGEVGAVALGMLLFSPACLALIVPSLWLAFPGMVVFGLGIPVAVVGYNTLLQRTTPAAVLGRVAAATDALVSGPQAVAIALGAVLVTVVDYRLLFLLMGVAMVAAGWYVWHARALTPGASAVDAAGPDGVEPLADLDGGRVRQG